MTNNRYKPGVSVMTSDLVIGEAWLGAISMNTGVI